MKENRMQEKNFTAGISPEEKFACAETEQMWNVLKDAVPSVEVPEMLSVNIRNYAAAAIQKKQRRFHLKYVWMPAAAALFICFGIAYTALPGLPGGNYATPVVKSPEYYSGMDTLDSDLLALTTQLEQASDKLFGETALFASATESLQNTGGEL